MASISHDIRTPIQSITLVAELMRRTACAPSGAVQMLALAQRLQSHALSVAELLSEVIDLASFDEGKVVLHVSDFSLNELLQEQCQRLSPQAEAKGLVLRVGDGLLPLNLRSDRAKLGRVLANLANNAIKFTTQGSVTLSFNVDERRCVHIGVADTGCGIRPENLGGIFGDFCQESSPLRRPAMAGASVLPSAAGSLRSWMASCWSRAKRAGAAPSRSSCRQRQ